MLVRFRYAGLVGMFFSVFGLTACGGGASDETSAAAAGAPAQSVPTAPEVQSVQALDGGASIAFTAPASDGGSAILGYVASCTATAGGASATGTSSPLTVYNLSNDRTYLCSVQAQNAIGLGAASASFSVTPRSADSSGIDPRNLPLGDDRFTTTTPQIGYLYVCSLPTSPNPPGKAPWINADGISWDSTAKITVQGQISWPDHAFATTLTASNLFIAGNNLPDHVTGTFPIARTDPAYAYDGNPNAIAAQSIAWNLPAEPTVASNPRCTTLGAIGVLISGAMLFNAADADGRDAVAHEVQDICQGHPQGQGKYHYHSISSCLNVSDSEGAHSELVGWAADGFGIYGNRGEQGQKLSNADLDICHGHSHAIAWRGENKVMYHYHETKEFPYTVGCFRGTPVNLL